MDRRRLTLIIALFMLLCTLVLPWALPVAPYNTVLAFLLGGCIGALYTMGNVLLGERFRGADLAAASTLFAVMWNIGTLIGPSIGGLGLDLSSEFGLPLALTLMVASILPFAIQAALRSRPVASARSDV
jgi:MFS family permease